MAAAGPSTGPTSGPTTGPTTAFWQTLLEAAPDDAAPPWRFSVPVPLPDGRWLRLPVRALPHEPGHGVASLLLNHASFEVADALAAQLTRRIASLRPDVVVGLPTLGLGLAAAVARGLGHARCVPLGTSRKFWYDDSWSAEVVSVTSPVPGKRVYLDPNLLPLVQGRRVLLVDDAVSTGRTADAPWRLLERAGAQLLGLGVAMRQGRRWEAALGPDRAAAVHGVFDSPLLRATPEGWVPRG